MSAICLFIPVMAEVSMPVIASLATSALTAAGYRILEKKGTAADAAMHTVELSLKHGGEIAGQVGEGDTLCFAKKDIQITLAKDPEGRLAVRASAPGMSEADLKQAGQAALDAIVQAYVQQKLTAALKQKGFKIEQKFMPDGSIRLMAKKWD